MPDLLPASSVYPAPAASSAAERVVATAMWGRPRAAWSTRSASLTASILAASIGLPPPRLTTPSTCASPARLIPSSTCTIGACWPTTTVTATRASPNARCTTLTSRSSATKERVVTRAMRCTSRRASSWANTETDPGPQWMTRGFEYMKSSLTAWSYYGRVDRSTSRYAGARSGRTARQSPRRDDPGPRARRVRGGHHDGRRRADPPGLRLPRTAGGRQRVVSEPFHRAPRDQRAIPQLGTRGPRKLADQGRGNDPRRACHPAGLLPGRVSHPRVRRPPRAPVRWGGRAERGTHRTRWDTARLSRRLQRHERLSRLQ